MTTVIKLVKNDVGKIAAGLTRQARAAAKKAALDTKREIADRMSDTKSGRIYKRGQKIHQASAPGEAPAIDTGTLVNSIQVADYGRAGAMVSTNTEYADVLELGGRHVLARPFMRPAVEKIAPKFLGAMRKLLQSNSGQSLLELAFLMFYVLIFALLLYGCMSLFGLTGV